METVFSHNPTREELIAIGCTYFTQEQYEQFFADSEGDVWFDLALLFRVRSDKKNESRAWSHIPERRDEYLRGFDCFGMD